MKGHNITLSTFSIILIIAGSFGIMTYAEEYHRPDYNEMLSLVFGLMSKYDVDKVYIDGANPSFIKSLKLQIGEDADTLDSQISTCYPFVTFLLAIKFTRFSF
jgi:hypothetical protein